MCLFGKHPPSWIFPANLHRCIIAKNYLFAGSHDAAQNAAMIYSFMATCKLNNIDPAKWLVKVLSKINETKTSDLHKLLPFNFEG
ncbi:MAG: transposase domain-containing protein [Flavobacteriales bacterium]|nr:MAG: transposase domain-containing protein [Flavobacteriales bacterium]